jgi:hypothetical protein
MNENLLVIELSPIAMQRLKTISLVEGKTHEEIISNLIQDNFLGMKENIENFFKKETAQNNTLNETEIEKVNGRYKITKRETDVYMIPQFDAPEE